MPPRSAFQHSDFFSLRQTLRFLCAVLFLGLSDGAASDVSAKLLDEVIDALQKKYAAVEGFSAEFRQIYASTVNAVRKEERGIVYMKKPGRMRWEYQAPEIKFFISDGKKSYFYVPSDRQVTEQRSSTDDAGNVPILFLLGRGNLRGDFSIRWENREPKRNGDNYLLRLEPKTPQTAWTAVLVELQRTDFTIERLVVIDSMEDRSEFILSRFNPAAKISDDLFKFKIPKGVEILNIEPH